MKRYSEFLHVPTGSYRQIIGARFAEAGKVFATVTRENARERLFLVDTFDQANKVEIAALWETLWAKESARIKAKARKDRALENMRHAQEQSEWRSEDSDEDQDDIQETEPATTEFETIAPEDSCGDPLPEIEEEEIEVED
ncbi:MAG: hypothetical protein WCC97_08480 [Candidatus Acidiferrales bacterium]